MPIYNLQLVGKGRDAKGKEVILPPGVALAQKGPCIEILAKVPQDIGALLIQKGEEVPQPIKGVALIDTGSMSTCIDDDLAQRLKLPVIDVVQLSSATEHKKPANVYPAMFEITGTPIRAEVKRAIGANLKGQGLAGLIGRDILSICTLYYNGPAGTISLCL